MKVFKNRRTGRLGETQFGEDSQVLIRNAQAAGIPDDDIEIVDMIEQEYKAMIFDQDFNELSYAEKRRRAYPPLEDLADALVKKGSADPAVSAEGDSQYAEYISKCLGVKTRYPKS